jgi:hypothetical protein
MDHDPRSPSTPSRNGHFGSEGIPDFQQRCGRSVTQYRSWAEADDGGDPTPLDRESGVTDGVDAAMNAVEPPLLEPVRDCSWSDPDGA